MQLFILFKLKKVGCKINKKYRFKRVHFNDLFYTKTYSKKL